MSNQDMVNLFEVLMVIGLTTMIISIVGGIYFYYKTTQDK